MADKVTPIGAKRSTAGRGRKRAPAKSRPSRAGAQTDAIARDVRRAEGTALVLAGVNRTEIARRLGISPKQLREDVRTYLDQQHGLTTEVVEDYRAIQIARYERLLMRLTPAVEQGDDRAINTAAKILGQLDRVTGVTVGPNLTVNVNREADDLALMFERLDALTAMQVIESTSAELADD